ncbi:endonuclease domain-containing protein [Streptomyces zinciresistens]|uniref:endonuclease domain-containing protein n=1 Tax=Streptomyces zinciresistens TaxID=1073330 RepID=UPI0005BAC65F
MTRASKHTRSFLDVHLLFEHQGYKCAICPVVHADGDGLHLDHGHECCPNKGESCGQCIRGLPCWGCNGGVCTSVVRAHPRSIAPVSAAGVVPE